MTDEEFSKQYAAAQPRGEFAQAVRKYVTDAQTALGALQELHERLQTLSADINCTKPLYFLSEDLRDLLNEADEYYRTGGIAMGEIEFKDEEET
jgi:hypothetical protein